MMRPEELQELKQYLHVDHDDDDVLIHHLWEAAKQYLFGAGVADTITDTAWLSAAALVLQWYDGVPLPPGAQQLINQQKLSDPSF